MADTENDDKLAKWLALRDTLPSEEERETLTPWVALGLIMHDLYGYSYKEVCEKIRNGKGAATLAKSAKSPAGRRLRATIMELADNPVELTKLYMKAQSMDVTADFLLALEWAKEAHDYRAVHQMTKDLLNLATVSGDSKQREQPQVVHIHLESGSLDIPIVKTDYEVLDD